MNPFFRNLSCACLVAAVVAIAPPSLFAAGVSVGGSALIETLHYSDTFTFASFGGAAGRADGGFPADAALNVENIYGNPGRAWSAWMWTLNSDANSWPADPSFPILTGVGSETGMTQSGLFGGGSTFGIEYGLSTHYVVQFDAVQTDDRVNITSGPVRNTIGGGANAAGQRSLSVFFRGDARSSNAYPNIEIYNPYIGGTDSGLGLDAMEIVEVGQWGNYAVRFDQANNEIEIFVNEMSLGILDMATFAGGAYADWSNTAVSLGGWDEGTNSVLWTDNFQVGAAFPVPEPTGCFLALSAFAGVAASRRRITRICLRSFH